MWGISNINFSFRQSSISSTPIPISQINYQSFSYNINDNLNISNLNNVNPLINGLVGGLLGGMIGGLLSSNPLSIGFPQNNNQNINNQMLINLLFLLLILIASQNQNNNFGGVPFGGGIPFGGGLPFGGGIPFGGCAPFGGGTPFGSCVPFGGGTPFGGGLSPFGFPNPNNSIPGIQQKPGIGPQQGEELQGGNGSVVNLALQQVGKPYIFGAEGPNAFDCSGLVQWAFKRCGRNLPRTADQQFRIGTPVPRNQLQAGDLVFFANTYKPGISHVGIYIGNGKFVHAANSKKGVIVSNLSEAYYAQHYAGAKRV
ncbi:MAG: C40 family peptidase [bacterium]|nr:C40 family peptidase [bacterium]